jgi:hypothetical protein
MQIGMRVTEILVPRQEILVFEKILVPRQEILVVLR